jgi:hypothetical protein
MTIRFKGKQEEREMGGSGFGREGEGGTLGISFLFALCGKAVAASQAPVVAPVSIDLQPSQQN